VSVAWLGEINICTRGWSSGFPALHRSQEGNTELYFSWIVDRIQYKQAMPCVMFLYPKRAEECPRITNAAKQHEDERLDLIALAHAFSTFLAQAVFYSCARENGRVDVLYDV